MKKVSVVIPCRNEKNNIRNCVEAILKSDYSSLEVLVVDGMSDDGTRKILAELEKLYPNVKCIDNQKKLTPFAFNLGVQNSSGDFVQIVGSRNILAPDYISKLVEILETQPQIACVGGDYQHIYETNQGRYIASAMESRFGVGPGNYRTKDQDCYVDTVGVPMYRKTIFSEIGMFDEQLTRNQDDDYNYRVTKKGHKIYYCAQAKVTYFVRGTYKKLFNQFMQYGYFKVFVNRKHHAVTTLRQLVPISFLLFLVIGGFASLVSPWFALLFLVTMMAYFFLGAWSSIPFAKKWWEVFPIQAAMLLMHLAYGYGYFRGVVDFLLLNRSPSARMQQQTT